MPKVNPEILVWARETACFSLEEAAAKLPLKAACGRAPSERLAELESGEAQPTRAMLGKMAEQYRRPLLTFYLSRPPRRGDHGEDFRTLPVDYPAADRALIDALIRRIRARHGFFRAALEDEDDVDRRSFVDSMTVDDGISALVASIRKTLALDAQDLHKQPTARDAFDRLRHAAENAGVFVLLVGDLGSDDTALDLQGFRGFALADDVAPFVVINERDSPTSWSLTLVHELAHIWLGHTGVSGKEGEHPIEEFCNDVAGNYLLPANELLALDVTASPDKASAPSGGPSFYVARRHQAGDALIDTVRRLMRAGDLTTSKAGKILGVTPQQVQLLFEAGGAGGVRSRFSR